MTYRKWAALGFDTWTLAFEAQGVIASRLSKIARGDAAALAETELMVREKLEAGAALMTMALTGAMGATPYSGARRTVSHYRKAVRKNRRRLAA